MQIAAPLTSEAAPVLQRIEVASSLQIPSFHIIGLPSQEVAEARERVRAAIQASELKFPRRRVVINLSPASIRKRGTGLDLGMALSILVDARPAAFDRPGEVVAWGELGLDGRIKPVGQLMRVVYASWKFRASWILLSQEECDEASSCLESLQVLVLESGELSGKPPAVVPVATLADAWKTLKGLESLPRLPARGKPEPKPPVAWSSRRPPEPASNLLRLSPFLERCIGAAVAGRHHLLLLGPRGTGKSHALEWLIALQPEASATTWVHHQLIRELVGARSDSGPQSPIRRLGSQVRPAALIGSASAAHLRPGEFSLAHGGVLIADELPEWARDSREAFREPLERGRVTLSRVHGAVELPARFTLAANGNLCPCGGWPASQATALPTGDSTGTPDLCRCKERVRRSYLSRLSGPLLDRIDMTALVGTVQSESGGTSSVTGDDALSRLRRQVDRTRMICRKEWGRLPGEIESADLDRILAGNPFWQTGLAEVRLRSLRSRHKVLRIAMTLSAWCAADETRDAWAADESFQGPGFPHFLEASLYRAERLGLG